MTGKDRASRASANLWICGRWALGVEAGLCGCCGSSNSSNSSSTVTAAAAAARDEVRVREGEGDQQWGSEDGESRCGEINGKR